MKVGILIKDLEESFVLKYFDILKHNNIDFVTFNVTEAIERVKSEKITHLIYRWSHYDDERQIAHTILPIIENELEVKCFPNQKTCWHYDDKIRQYYLLNSKGYPITESWVFWDKKSALSWAENAELPVVFKTKMGAGSTNVILIKDKKELNKIINIMFGSGIKTGAIPMSDNVRSKDFEMLKFIKKNLSNIKRKIDGRYRIRNWQTERGYVLFQKFLPNNDFDTRVTVIGGRAFAFRRFNRENDFRSSGSGKIDHDKTKIDMDFIKLAQKVSKEMGFQSMAYDMLRNEKGDPEFCEISYTYQDKAVYNCLGYWDEDLNWHEGHFWPQYWQLVDFFGIDLKQLEKQG